jgi:glycerol uptake facilitator-like aquaporin
MHLTESLIAECLRTFALIFIGAGAVVAFQPSSFAAIASLAALSLRLSV